MTFLTLPDIPPLVTDIFRNYSREKRLEEIISLTKKLDLIKKPTKFRFIDINLAEF